MISTTYDRGRETACFVSRKIRFVSAVFGLRRRLKRNGPISLSEDSWALEENFKPPPRGQLNSCLKSCAREVLSR
jgi:hypothetical protein